MEEIKNRFKELQDKIELKEKKEKIKKIEKESADPSFWKDISLSTQKMKELSYLNKQVEKVENIKELIDSEEFEKAEKELEELEFNLYFSGPHDEKGAIFSIHAGQGGTEAMDWTQMLLRMYQRFFDSKGWSYKIIDKIQGEEAGLKSVTMSVSEPYAYGYLKSEAGTHRLVRQSPFNADNLRQTSFALVEVVPIFDEDKEVKIKDDELEWDFFRSSGAGGQNVNKVSSAVRVRHIPTGIVVECQQERHQAQNRETALKILKGKLWRLMEEQKVKKISEIKGKFKKASWGNQIRSYVLHPYHMVKDLRTKHETKNTQRVLDGDIEDFIISYLKNTAR